MRSVEIIHVYEDIISVENLLGAWEEFIRGKKNRVDVQLFQSRLFDNVYALHCELKHLIYRHGPYEAFKLNDPKPRDINKATVRDRLVHHAIYRKLYLFFDRRFIYDSYSCRNAKGTHKALDRFRKFALSASRSHTKTLWVLKCDIRKFFASIDHSNLQKIIDAYIPDDDIRRLIGIVVKSFHSTKADIGLPLGNLTSQLFVNIYMNEFDQFVKHSLKTKYYIRYADDFVILDQDRLRLKSILIEINAFLSEKLHLTLHPTKVTISTFASGIDFLGWIHFPNHRVLRTSTKRRMLKKVSQNPKAETLTSYQGLLKHGNAYRLSQQIVINANC